MPHNLGVEPMNICPHDRGIETRKTKGIKKTKQQQQ